MVDVARRRDDHVAGDVARRVERREHLGRDAADDVGPADDRPAQRVLAEHGLAEAVVDEVLRRILDHGDLLEHDLALGLEVVEER